MKLLVSLRISNTTDRASLVSILAFAGYAVGIRTVWDKSKSITTYWVDVYDKEVEG